MVLHGLVIRRQYKNKRDVQQGYLTVAVYRSCGWR